MAINVTNGYSISQLQRNNISSRYKTITKAINNALWNTFSEREHSFYVGSYGRGTAIDTSDIDILVEVPQAFYVQNSYTTYNPQSRLLQVVKKSVLMSYPRSDIRGDGQVVVVDFSDGMRFEILPAIPIKDYRGIVTYRYPDSHMGGRWKSTNPKAEQKAMAEKNKSSNGLLFDTCKHMRYIRDNYFRSYHLSGIVIDSFVYVAINNWRWLTQHDSSESKLGTYENELFAYYNNNSLYGNYNFNLNAPGSGDSLSTSGSLECLGKVLKKMAE